MGSMATSILLDRGTRALQAWFDDPVTGVHGLATLDDQNLLNALGAWPDRRILLSISLELALEGAWHDWPMAAAVLLGLDRLTRIPGSPLVDDLVYLGEIAYPELLEAWLRPRPFGPHAPWLAQHLRSCCRHRMVTTGVLRQFAAWAPPGSLVARVLIEETLAHLVYGDLVMEPRPWAISERPVRAILPMLTSAQARTAFLLLINAWMQHHQDPRHPYWRWTVAALVARMGPDVAATLLPELLRPRESTESSIAPEQRAPASRLRGLERTWGSQCSISWSAYQPQRISWRIAHHACCPDPWATRYLASVLAMVLPHGAEHPIVVSAHPRRSASRPPRAFLRS